MNTTKHTLIMRHDKDGNVRPEAMAAHTPGPWEYLATNANTLTDYTRVIFATVGECVAHVETNDDDGKPTEKGEANARLIAAAPELLDALQRVMRVASVDLFKVRPDLEEQVRAAIAKATGTI